MTFHLREINFRSAYAMVFLLLAGFSVQAAPTGGRGTVLLTWDKTAFAYGYRVEIKDEGERLIINRIVETNRLRLKLSPGRYFHRLTVLNKFRKPEGRTPWRSFSTSDQNVKLTPGAAAELPRKKMNAKKNPGKTESPAWTHWVPGAAALYQGRLREAAPSLGTLAALGLSGGLALLHAERTRTANTNDPLQRLFREPVLYLSVRDLFTGNPTAALIIFPARQDLAETRRLLRRDERIFYASVVGLGVLYFFHYQHLTADPTRNEKGVSSGVPTFFILPGKHRGLTAMFAWHANF